MTKLTLEQFSPELPAVEFDELMLGGSDGLFRQGVLIQLDAIRDVLNRLEYRQYEADRQRRIWQEPMRKIRRRLCYFLGHVVDGEPGIDAWFGIDKICSRCRLCGRGGGR